MIKVDEGIVEIRGIVPDIMSEYSLLTNRLHKVLKDGMDEENAKFMLEKAFKLALMDEDEVLNELKNSVSELMDFITEKLAKKGGEE